MLTGIAICYLRITGRGLIDALEDNTGSRLVELTEWLANDAGIADPKPVPASEDASFRRYFRVRTDGGTAIAMDAPPDREDSRRFIEIAGFLERIGVNSPRVLAAAPERGFLLLSDLGSTPYLAALKTDPTRADVLYGDALTALVAIQEQGRACQAQLPPYDETLLSFELSLFRDWLCGRHLGIALGGGEEAAWNACCRNLVENALRQPRVFVHRDYHSRNLMVTDTANPGILDFQDAVEGPVTYDLVSLLKDCYIRWPAARVRSWALHFHAALDPAVHRHTPADEFLRAFELMGVQRHLKAAGIFARLMHRDGKPGYLDDVPRTLAYIVELAPRYDELAFLAGLISEQVLPRLAGK
ncbi:MAG TPA: phosphotransferase [Woeseiaceae bacterium]|nr:phosphotransferase [Woeseiaceae bacterium]